MSFISVPSEQLPRRAEEVESEDATKGIEAHWLLAFSVLKDFSISGVLK
jgi:hypothetical protein